MPTERELEEQLALALAEAETRGLEVEEPDSEDDSVWPSDIFGYVNRESGRHYQPHDQVFAEEMPGEPAYLSEIDAMLSDRPRYIYFKGGEGGGKSVAGIIKGLERVRRRCNGIMGSPDFEHFKRSLWPEFQRWCPPKCLVERDRKKLNVEWQPSQPFALTFVTGATVLCGGFDDPIGWEGPNVNWAFFDEPRRHNKSTMLKVLDGRVRIPGPLRVTPQIWLSSTPRMNWLFEYFGYWVKEGESDPLAAFKEDARVVLLPTEGNLDNVDPEYFRKRAQSLTDSERRVYLGAEWEDTTVAAPFFPNMVMWDLCRSDVPSLRVAPRKQLESRDPDEVVDIKKVRKGYDLLVVALDAATGAQDTESDNFAIVAVTRHWSIRDAVAVRFKKTWRAKAGQKIRFRSGDPTDPGPEDTLRWLCENYSVVMVAYDPHQLIDLAHRMEEQGVAYMSEFPQGARRALADRLLLDLVVQGRFAHDGDEELRQHAKNADRKVDGAGSKIRIVKGRGPVDLLVATSMAAYECLELNI